MTRAAHITAGTVHMGGVLAVVPPTGRHFIGHMRRSDGGDALCLGLLRGIVGAMGDVMTRLQAVDLVLHAGLRLLVGTSLLGITLLCVRAHDAKILPYMLLSY